MKRKEPSKKQWKALFEAAEAFKKTKAWEWMYDSDVFGVKNPVSGEIGYCSVLGNAGECFGLVLYLGTQALLNYLDIQSGNTDPDPKKILFETNCLMFSLVDRSDLMTEDLKIIKELGLKFRGRNQWPEFRRYEPGYIPWFISVEEAEFMTMALEQAIDVALRFKDDEDLLYPPEDTEFLVRTASTEGEKYVWRDEVLSPAPLEEEEPIQPWRDKARISKLKNNIRERRGVWEMDLIFSPTPVRESERPYFPIVSLWVDAHSGMIITFGFHDLEDYFEAAREHFVAWLEKNHVAPEMIMVTSDQIFEILESVTRELDIKLTIVDRLPALDEAYSGFLDFFSEP